MKNHLTLPGLDVSYHSVSGLVDYSCEVRKSENERPSGVSGGFCRGGSWGVDFGYVFILGMYVTVHGYTI